MRRKVVIAAIGFGLIAAVTSPGGVAFADHIVIDTHGDDCEAPNGRVWSNENGVHAYVNAGEVCKEL